MKELKELFERYQRDVSLYLFSLCRDQQLAEELTADVFLQALLSIRSFRGDADEKTWLFSIARHRWYSYLRKKCRQPELELLELSEDAPSPEEQTFGRETIRRVTQLLDAEPERSRRVMQLRLEGLSFCEIGKALGISESSARVLCFRTRNRLRQQLIREGYVDE